MKSCADGEAAVGVLLVLGCCGLGDVLPDRPPMLKLYGLFTGGVIIAVSCCSPNGEPTDAAPVPLILYSRTVISTP